MTVTETRARLGAVAAPPASAHRSWAQMSWLRFRQHRAALLGLVLLGVILGAVLIGTLLLPPNAAYFTDTSALKQSPSAHHWLGTDEVGRDVFSRLLVAGRVSLAVGLLVAVLGVTIGLLAGAVAGFFGGWVDEAIMRFADALLAIPWFFSLIFLAAILGPGLSTTIFAITALSW